MSLFSTLQMSANTLSLNEIALQVTGQNISNANTPGYIRERVLLSPGSAQKVGGQILGMGAQMQGVVQVFDQALEERLRSSVSDYSASATISQYYQDLESIVGEMNDSDMSTSISDFYGAISDVLDQPESLSVRRLAIMKGQTVCDTFNFQYEEVGKIRSEVDSEVSSMADNINRLIDEIQSLNLGIAEMEGGDVTQSDAVGLRDQRLLALEELAEIIDVKVVEDQSTGMVNVYCSGDYLILGGISRGVEVGKDYDRGLEVSQIYMEEINSPLEATSGKLYGLMYARDEVLGAYQDQLDEFSQTFTSEFNKVYSSGQGINGFREVVATELVNATDVSLDQAGLANPPKNGSFEILVYNEVTDTTQTHEIQIDLNGIGTDDTTLESLVEQINSEVSGVTATINRVGALTLSCDDANHEIGFANDTSKILTSLGINTFFTGDQVGALQVNDDLMDDSSLFAASRGGINADTENALDLAALYEKPLPDFGDASLSVQFDRMVNDVFQNTSLAIATCEGDGVYESTLRGQKQAKSGVNLDEEAIQMLTYQHCYQSAARMIQTISELFDVLVAI